MCCLPIKCLRVIVFIGSFCAITIAIALLGLTIYVQVSKRQIISAANQGAVTISLIALYLSSILFLLLGLAGLSGSMKRRQTKRGNDSGACLLAFFGIGVIIFFLVFLVGTIFFFIGPSLIFGTDCTQGSKTSLIKDLYETSNQAYGSFCRTCACNIKDTNSYLYQIISTQGGLIQQNGAEKFGDCSNIQSSSTFVEIMAALEDLLGCGGWCPSDSPPFGLVSYRFRNINDCVEPSCLGNIPYCHPEFESFMATQGKTVGYGCLCALLVCFLNIVAVCCICCHPTKNKKGSNFYSRMIQMD